MPSFMKFFWAILFSFLAISKAWSQEAQTTSLIVQYKPSSLLSLHSSLREQLSSKIPILEQRYLSRSNTEILQLASPETLLQAMEEIQKQSNVAYVEKNEIISAHSVPNDSRFSEQWALSNISVERAWDHITNSSPLTVAIIDSGCNYTHPDIIPNLWRNSGEIPGNGVDDEGDGYIDDVYGYDFQNNDSNPLDDFGHGSMVFGIIGAAGNNERGISGISWQAQIMCLKVLDSNGNSTISKAIEAIDFAIQHEVKIINMSWGYTPNGSPSRALEEAIQRAQRAGLLVITSAGNGLGGMGQNNDTNFQSSNYPSSYPEDNLIAVAATDSLNHLASFSNYGQNSVDLGAPGVSILTTNQFKDYNSFTGTSAAAPHVTGAAALVWAFNPSLSSNQVKRLLLETTDPVAELSEKSLTGGKINVGKALLASPAGGGHLLEFSSTLPTSQETGTAMGSEDAQITSHSGGCSLNPHSNKNKLASFIFFICLGIYLGWFRNLKHKV